MMTIMMMMIENTFVGNNGPLHKYVMMEMAFFDPTANSVMISNVSRDPPCNNLVNLLTIQ